MKVSDSLKVEDRQIIKGKRQKAKKLYLVAAVLALLCTVGSAFSVIEYRTYSVSYRSDISLAQMGTQHLRKAVTLMEALSQNPLDSQTVNQARQEFAAALPAFVQLNNNLLLLPGISTFIPVYGARLNAALHLAPLAIELSQAGLAGCNILNIVILRLHDPLSTQKSQGLTMTDLATINQDFHRIKTAFNLAFNQAKQVQTANLQFDPHLSKLFATLLKQMPVLQIWLDEIGKLLPILPTLLGVGTPTNYLIEVLDSTELRPGGGFIGNYGFATLSGGRLIDARITDVVLLDRFFIGIGHRFPLPPAYAWFDLAKRRNWGFRDSNLEADFPTSAWMGEQKYMQEGGKVPVQGVIAITPALIQHALEIIGPIYVPEYHETITAQNLIARIHYHQLGPAGEGSDRIPSPDGHSSLRKRFTELLAEQLLANIRHLSPASLAKFIHLIINSVRSKDLQIFFNSSIAEHLLQDFHLDAAIQSPSGDGLFVVDANIASDKANNFIIDTLDDQVTIDGQGNAIHHTIINYAWLVKGQNYGSPIYRDYMRLYVPPGSMLHAQDGWEPRGTSEAFGREVWAGYFTLTSGQSRTVTFIWTVPGAAKKDANGWHYQYLIQRQAGAQWTLHMQITLPSCAVVTNKWGGPMSGTHQVVALTQSLNEDMSLGLDYACR